METKEPIAHCFIVELRSWLVQMPTTFVLVLAVSALVALPSLLAIVRKHPHWVAITVVDILLGWTVIGWFAALVWVLRPVKKRQPRQSRPAKIRSAAAVRRRTAAQEPTALDTAANDNRSVPFFSEATLPALDSDIYEQWLDRGSALSESAATAADPALAGEATPMLSPAPPKPKAAA